jgi:hypothetical protein
MSISSVKLAVGSALLASGLGLSGTASALTLNTSGLKANATLTFSVSAYGSATAAGITFGQLANMTRNADVAVTDEYGNVDMVPQWNLPVTKADVTVGLLSGIKTNYGNSTRSVLQIKRSGRTLTLANFVLNFKTNQITADYILDRTAGTKGGTVFDFKPLAPEKVSLKGLVLNQSVTVGKMILTQSAQTTMGDFLALSPPLRATLVTQDWGTIATLVTSYRRSPAVSDKPFTVADLPQ